MTEELFFRPHRQEARLELAAQPMFSIRKPLAKQLGVATSNLPQQINAAFAEIEAGEGRYFWGFELKEDAESFCRFSRSHRYKDYPRPRSIEEAGTALFAALLPQNCGEILELTGTRICRHPYLGPRAGAGSVQAEAPHLISRERWLEAYGFGLGWLVLVRLHCDTGFALDAT